MKTDFRFSSVLLIALAGTAGSLMAHACCVLPCQLVEDC